ncbi:stage II sporulation protein D [Oceanobacillus bengalensis]|uniref:stage II sporulation protein D n=1 Tax=Oceanobacillus bengalensis TaxID=1435466 RepID=UPI001FE4BF5E|nr:stage II sporulation protein D [Oceanobacillus bengalensis]
MIRNKYKPVKRWKKKNATLIKQLKRKQSFYGQKTNTDQVKLKKVIPFSNNKRPYLQAKQSKWRIPTVFTISSLILTILVIPTLIVVPSGKSESSQEIATIAEELDTAAKIEESPFAVEVMRSTTKTVEDIPLEDYVAGVVASEMPIEFELEALKAQALAARTYLVNHLLHGNEASEYDVTDTVQHQVYRSEEELLAEWGSKYTERMNKIREAVNATKGEILTYKDAPITAAFFSTSNGYTENSEDYWESELPYLRSVESPWDKDSPKYLHQNTFTIEQVETALEIDLPNETPLFLEEARTESGRVKELGIEGHSFSGRDIRDKLELKSSDFTIEQNNGHLVFTTEGYGHGIGMSQYGANYMAKEGKTYQDIVKHYYQGVEISTVNDTTPTLVSK